MSGEKAGKRRGGSAESNHLWEVHMEKRKIAEQVQIPGKALVLAGLFLAGLVLAGGKAVFGMFPFGLAAASPGCSFVGLMLKLKLQYFGPLM